MTTTRPDTPGATGPAPGRDEHASGSTSRPSRGSRLATLDVIEHLEHLILGGDLEAGDSLPSEAELSATLGVSRLTVREGVRALQARGLIEVAHGRRPVVARPNALPLSDFFSAAVRRDARGLLELLEVRMAVEVHTAQLAARNATRSDLLSMETALAAMVDAGDDETAFNAADVRFHAAIATASGNRMLNFLVEGMEGPLHSSRMQSTRGFLARCGALDDLLEAHRSIYEKIAAHDAGGAASCMRKHLSSTRKDLRTSFELPS